MIFTDLAATNFMYLYIRWSDLLDFWPQCSQLIILQVIKGQVSKIYMFYILVRKQRGGGGKEIGLSGLIFVGNKFREICPFLRN